MKCMLDTNILVSAALFPNSTAAAAYMKAATMPFETVVCNYTMAELQRVFSEKFPERLQDHDRFIETMKTSIVIVDTPPEEEHNESESKIRDAKDRPILRSALIAGVDVLVTGDKDFLEAGIESPLCLSAADFLSRY